MVNIIHRVGIQAPIESVHAAVSTAAGISQWWTRQTVQNDDQGNKLEVRFTDTIGQVIGSMRFAIEQHSTTNQITWTFDLGPEEWIGTDVTFELKQEGSHTIVLFGHNHWREPVEFTAHCSMKWATFLLSLKELLESGSGRPSPIDIKIDNWN